METLEVKVARLEAQVAAVKENVVDIRSDQKSQNSKLSQLLEIHQQRKGAQAVLKIIVGLGGSSGVVALIAQLWEHIK
jgi:hypothetical protein